MTKERPPTYVDDLGSAPTLDSDDPSVPAPGSGASSEDHESPFRRSSTLQSGWKIAGGRYRALMRLGSGGFGEVWAARDTETDHRVALKVLRANMAEKQRIVDGFEREVRAAAHLSHPYITPLLDTGVDDDLGQRFYTMELVKGQAIDELELDLKTILLLFDQLMEALAYAHARGVIHRDLKPDNVLVAEGAQPQVRLLDFGVARIVNPALDEAAWSAGQRDGAIGTPHFMSPEQASGMSSAVGPASDIYSAGVVLYSLIAKKLPFDGDMMSVLYQHVLVPHAPLEAHPDLATELPPELVQLVDHMLAKSYLERPESTADVRRALRRIIGPEVGAPERWPLLSCEPPATLLRWRDRPLVGREPEMLAMRQALDNLDNSTQVVLCTGPSGVGKTRLVRALVSQAQRQGTARVVEVPLDDFGSAQSAVHYGLYRHLRSPRLEQKRLCERVAEVFPRLTERERAQLERFMLTGGRVSASLVGLDDESLVGAWGDLLQRTFLHQARVPTTRPLILWIDGGEGAVAVEAAEFARHIYATFRDNGAPLLVIWSIGDSDTEAARELIETMPRAAPMLLAINPLGSDEQGRLVRQFVPAVQEQVLQHLRDRCGGLPLLIEESVIEWLQSGALDQRTGALDPNAAGDIPAKVEEQVSHRLAATLEQWQFSREVHAALKQLAALGVSFAPELAERVLEPVGIDPRELTRSGLLVSVQQGLLLRFAHPLFVDVLAKRARTTGQWLTMLERAAVLRIEGAQRAIGRCDFRGALARLYKAMDHLDSAGHRPESELRLGVLDMVALVSYRQWNTAQLREHAHHLGRLAGGGDFATAAAIWLALADVLLERWEPARAALDTVLADDQLQGEMAARALQARGLLASLRKESTGSDQLGRALDHADLAVDSADADQWEIHRRRELQADISRDLAEAVLAEGQPRLAAATARLVLRSYADLGDVHGEALTFLLLTRALRSQLQKTLTSPSAEPDGEAITEVRRHLARAAQLIGQLEDQRGKALLAWETAMLLLLENELEAADVAFQQAGQLFAIARDPFTEALTRNSRGEVARKLGQLDVAREHYQAFHARMEAYGHDAGAGMAQQNLGYVMLGLKRPDKARVHFESALGRLPASMHGPARAGLALAHGQRNALDRARIVLEPLENGVGDDPDAAQALGLLHAIAMAAGDHELVTLIEANLPT